VTPKSHGEVLFTPNNQLFSVFWKQKITGIKSATFTRLGHLVLKPLKLQTSSHFIVSISIDLGFRNLKLELQTITLTKKQ